MLCLQFSIIILTSSTVVLFSSMDHQYSSFIHQKVNLMQPQQNISKKHQKFNIYQETHYSNDYLECMIDSMLTLNENCYKQDYAKPSESFLAKQNSSTEEETSRKLESQSEDGDMAECSNEAKRDKTLQVKDFNSQEGKRIQIKSIEQRPKASFNSADQTKNIPKNFLKAIFNFILEQTNLVKKLFLRKRFELPNKNIDTFLEFIRTEKESKRYSIERLQSLWLNEQFGKLLRIISFEFLRKRSISYILGSKIYNKFSHIKYRTILLDSLTNPNIFTSFK